MYYTLLVRHDAHSPWEIEFGSDARHEVVEERRACTDNGFYAKNLLIITTLDADQQRIDNMVTELNTK